MAFGGSYHGPAVSSSVPLLFERSENTRGPPKPSKTLTLALKNKFVWDMNLLPELNKNTCSKSFARSLLVLV